VTGGNRGIGLATARRLVAAGHSVCITARREADARAALDAIDNPRATWVQLDLASLSATRRCAEELAARGDRFDVVLHNAGVLLAPKTRRMTEDGLEQTLQVNAVAPLLLTQRLRPVLDRPARLVWTGSSLHAPGSRGGAEVDFRFDDIHMDAHYHYERAYKNSKLAQIWVSTEIERRFGAEGLHSDVVCPGFVPTTAAAHLSGFRRFALAHILSHMPFATSLEEAATRIADACLTPRDAPGGRYFHGGALSTPSDDARDPEQAARFYALATKLVDEA
jgi:NAD(P)-dependent dehydrogenase (short-subunit alcohol dehydrogenase family)